MDSLSNKNEKSVALWLAFSVGLLFSFCGFRALFAFWNIAIWFEVLLLLLTARFCVVALQNDWECDWREYLPIFAALLFSGTFFWLSLAAKINQITFWQDEASTLSIVALPIGEMRHSLIVTHLLAPPLDYLILRYWIKLCGLLGVARSNAEFFYRIPYMLYHLASTLLLGGVIHSVVHRTLWKGWLPRLLSFSLAASFFTVSMALSYSIEVRTYIQSEFWTTAVFAWAYFMLLRREFTLSQWVIFACLLGLGGYNHIYTVLVGIPLGVFVGLSQMRRQGWTRTRSSFLILAMGLIIYYFASRPYLGPHWAQHDIDWVVFKSDFWKLYAAAKVSYFDNYFPANALFSAIWGWPSIPYFECVLFLVGLRIFPVGALFWFSVTLAVGDFFIPLLGVLSVTKGHFLNPRHSSTFLGYRFYVSLFPTFALLVAMTRFSVGWKRAVTVMLVLGSLQSVYWGATSFSKQVSNGDFSSKTVFDLKRAWTWIGEQNPKVTTVIVQPGSAGLDWWWIKPVFDEKYKVIENMPPGDVGQFLRRNPSSVLLVADSEPTQPDQKLACGINKMIRIKIHRCRTEDIGTSKSHPPSKGSQ